MNSYLMFYLISIPAAHSYCVLYARFKAKNHELAKKRAEKERKKIEKERRIKEGTNKVYVQTTSLDQVIKVEL